MESVGLIFLSKDGPSEGVNDGELCSASYMMKLLIS